MCWGFAATLVIIVMPLYESRESLYAILCGMMGWEVPDAMDESRDGAKNGGDHSEFWKKEQPAKAKA